MKRTQTDTIIHILLAGLVAGLVGACSDSPDGTIYATWSLRFGGDPASCTAARISNVRVDATDVATGDAYHGGTRACTDGTAYLSVPGGSYEITADALDPAGVAQAHEHQLVVVASGGLTTAELVLPLTPTGGNVRARWSAPCVSGDRVEIDVQPSGGGNLYKNSAACELSDITSPPVPPGSYLARLVWMTSGGTTLGSSYWSTVTVASPEQVVELPFQYF